LMRTRRLLAESGGVRRERRPSHAALARHWQPPPTKSSYRAGSNASPEASGHSELDGLEPRRLCRFSARERALDGLRGQRAGEVEALGEVAA
jgi:hypothetical protein